MGRGGEGCKFAEERGEEAVDSDDLAMNDDKSGRND
jgi:hypothetical protein